MLELDELQAGLKIARRNSYNLRYADDIIQMAESEEKLKNLLMKVKDKDTKADFKLNIKKPRLCHLVSSLHGKIEGGKVEVLTDFIFLVSKITADGDCSHEIKRRCSLEEKL